MFYVVTYVTEDEEDEECEDTIKSLRIGNRKVTSCTELLDIKENACKSAVFKTRCCKSCKYRCAVYLLFI